MNRTRTASRSTPGQGAAFATAAQQHPAHAPQFGLSLVGAATVAASGELQRALTKAGVRHRLASGTLFRVLGRGDVVVAYARVTPEGEFALERAPLPGRPLVREAVFTTANQLAQALRHRV